MLLICTRACVPCSCRAAVPVHTQHCCVVSKYATTGIDYGLCQRLDCLACVELSCLHKELYHVHIGGVALEDSVGHEDEPVSDLQLKLLDGIVVIG